MTSTVIINRMEETFLKLKIERDELLKRVTNDSTDGKDKSVQEDIDHTIELNRQKKAYEAQFIEYVSISYKVFGFGCY